jgi:hypothetical protein
MIGQSSRPRRSRRYSEWNVMTLARSPVIPKIRNVSADRGRPARVAVAIVSPPWCPGDLTVVAARRTGIARDG